MAYVLVKYMMFVLVDIRVQKVYILNIFNGKQALVRSAYRSELLLLFLLPCL